MNQIFKSVLLGLFLLTGLYGQAQFIKNYTVTYEKKINMAKLSKWWRSSDKEGKFWKDNFTLKTNSIYSSYERVEKDITEESNWVWGHVSYSQTFMDIANGKQTSQKEVSEKTYRKIYSKLSLQREKIEQARHKDIDPEAYTDRKDIFDRLVNLVQAPLTKKADPLSENQEKLEYYRAQMIMARKAIQTLEHMQYEYDRTVFMPEIFEEVISLYRHYKERCETKGHDLLMTHAKELESYMSRLAQRSLASSGARALSYFRENGLVDETTEEEIKKYYAPGGHH